MTSHLIINGHLIDPAQSIDQQSDIFIHDGLIKSLGPQASLDAKLIPHIVHDVKGSIISPGFIDLHVHFREPGQTRKESIETGSRAAVAGGFSSVCGMANTTPANDCVQITELMLERASSVNLCRYFPVGGVSQNLKGQELSDLGLQKQAGCIAFSDDGYPIMNAALMKRALEYSRWLKVPIVAHEEDLHLSNKGVMHDGAVSAGLGCLGIPSSAEEVMLARDIILADETGGHLHVAHISTKRSLSLVREAKKRGTQVTCEVTPHHFALTDAELMKFDTNYKMSPPLRTPQDVEAIFEALADGTIDAIATDHAPHGLVDKNCPLPVAAFGVIGLETALPIAVHLLLKNKIISRPRLIELFTKGPAECFHLDRLGLGSLAIGNSADITIMDLEANILVDKHFIKSKSTNTPFRGLTLPGKVMSTWVKGRKVWDVTDGFSTL